jgi:hypothetical protein
MKLESLLLLALSPLPASFAAPPAAPPGATAPAAQDVHQQAYDDFVKRFKQFLGVNDADGMADLVRKNPGVAVRYADTLCQQISAAGSDELEKQIAALRKAWKTALKTDFVDNLYEYHSLLDARGRKERERLVQSYDKALGRYVANLEGDRTDAGFEASAEEFVALADAFEQVGDLLNVGRSWVVVSACWDEGVRGNKANLYSACEAATQALVAYDKLGLVGPDVATLRTRHEFLVANGYDQPAPEGGASGAPNAPVVAAGAAALTLPMAFEMLEEATDFERPSYHSDEVYQSWPYLVLQRGNPAKLATQPETGLTIEFLGGVQFVLHGAGAEDPEPVIASGNPDVAQATINDQHGQREWALTTRIGIQQDVYQGRNIFFAPSDDFMYLFVSPAASVVGQLGEEQVRVIDENLDGIYGSGIAYGSNWGLGPESYQPDLDCVVIGKSKRALPWSRHLEVGDSWYQLEALQGGSTLKATPVEVQTGTLLLDFDGAWPEWLVLQGQGGLEGTFVDLCQNGRKKPVEVPVGDYRLVSGLIRKGKKVKMMKCLVLGNDDVPSWKVSAGAETLVELGGDLRFDFAVERSGDQGVIKGSSVQVIGKAGEWYDRFWNCAPEPVVSARRAGTKRGGKPVDMPKVVGDLNEMNDDGTLRWSFADVWRPLDLEVELVRGGDDMELQMSEKKNALLGGPIESSWK